MTLVTAPDEDALDEAESIVVERSWEDQLSYLVVLSGKSFPIGTKIPLWIKFVPLAKIRIHRIVVTMEEKVRCATCLFSLASLVFRQAADPYPADLALAFIPICLYRPTTTPRDAG